MNTTLKMVNEKLLQFGSGKIDLDSMWQQIDSNLLRMQNPEDYTDPFEDDKAELRTKLSGKH